MSTALFEEWVNLVEAARMIGIHAQSLRRLVKQKKIAGTLFAGRYLFRREDVDRFRESYDPRPGRKPMRRLL